MDRNKSKKQFRQGLFVGGVGLVAVGLILVAGLMLVMSAGAHGATPQHAVVEVLTD